MADWARWTSERLAALAAVHQRRALPYLDSLGPLTARLRGQATILFSSNDYLGLSHHPCVRAAIARAALAEGNGFRGSALVCGHTRRHAALESRLAALKGQPCAVLCPSGFAANVAAITSLAGPGCTIFSDAANHASIIDGCRLARRQGARIVVYQHCDMDDLAQHLADDDRPRKLIVSETLFSMEGDCAPLADLVFLARRHAALLMVDEAHASLVFGARGGGWAEHLGLEAAVDVSVGTLSKAFGGLGGFIATCEPLRALIINRGRPVFFSTALPSPIVAGLHAALDAAADGSLRAALWARIRQLEARLERPLHGPIVPIHLGSEAAALAAHDRLSDAGFHVLLARPPTVPPGRSGLRVTLSAAHRPGDVQDLVHALGATRPRRAARL